MGPSTVENRFIIDKTAHEALALSSLIEKDCALYHQNTVHLVFDSEHNVVAANFLARKLIDSLILDVPELLTQLAYDTLNIKDNSEHITIWDPSTNSYLEFTATRLDGGRYHYLTQKEKLFNSRFTCEFLKSFDRVENLVMTSNNFLWETDKTGIFSFISGTSNFGYQPNMMLGTCSHEILVSDQNNGLGSPFTTRTEINSIEVNILKADGTTGILLTSALPLFGENGYWVGARGIGRDVTHDRQRDAELSKAQNKERILQYINSQIREPDDQLSSLESAVQAITKTLAADGCQIFKFENDGDKPQIIVDGNLPFSIEEALKDGINKDTPLVFDKLDNRFAVYVTKYKNRTNGILIFWGIGESKRWDGEDFSLFEQATHLVGVELQHLHIQKRLERLSTTDPLTGLLNRRTFSETLEKKLVHQSKTQMIKGSLAYIDLDNFKLINDRLGHQAGDEVLTELSKKLNHLAQENDLVARLGGDEFAIWFDAKGNRDAKSILSSLIEDEPFFSKFTNDHSRPFGASVGIVEIDGCESKDLAQIMAEADRAMYKNKSVKKI
jgi:diguanylate cyclase (GGDEF)-like protein